MASNASTALRLRRPRSAGLVPSSLETREKWLGFFIFLPVVLVFSVFFAYPLIFGISLSFYKLDTLSLTGTFIGLGNFRRFVVSEDVRNALGNSLYWTLASLALNLVIGLAVALALNERFPGRNLARGLALSSYLIPVVVSAAIWQWMFSAQYGIVNYALVQFGLTSTPVAWLSDPHTAMPAAIVLNVWRSFPFVVIVFLPRLQTISEDLYSAAKVDGASAWDRFVDVTLPHLRSLFIVVVLLRFIFDFNDFTTLALLTGGGPVHATETLPLLVYRQMFGLFDTGAAAAVAVLMLLFLLLLAVAYLQLTGRSERVSE
ncbi:MAG TPA: sugar ABC transporter permease [Ktedonobacterales bacterium]|nr:sugar ABC transporter permease [Ktedonobacterales bacterium]